MSKVVRLTQDYYYILNNLHPSRKPFNLACEPMQVFPNKTHTLIEQKTSLGMVGAVNYIRFDYFDNRLSDDDIWFSIKIGGRDMLLTQNGVRVPASYLFGKPFEIFTTFQDGVTIKVEAHNNSPDKILKVACFVNAFYVNLPKEVTEHFEKSVSQAEENANALMGVDLVS